MAVASEDLAATSHSLDVGADEDDQISPAAPIPAVPNESTTNSEEVKPSAEGEGDHAPAAASNVVEDSTPAEKPETGSGGDAVEKDDADGKAASARGSGRGGRGGVRGAGVARGSGRGRGRGGSSGAAGGGETFDGPRWNSGAGAGAEAKEVKEGSAPSADKDKKEKEKKLPYTNPERFLTGGPSRDKLSPEALAEKMEKMKLQNEELKRRRELADADQDEYDALEAEARAAAEEDRRIQQAKREKQAEMQREIDDERKKNAERKMAKVENRDWDREKKEEDWNTPPRHRANNFYGTRDATSLAESGFQSADGYDSSPRGRGRGRGGGGGGGGRGRGGRGGAAGGGKKVETESKDDFPALSSS